eukprot:s4380_g2.t1
MRLWIKKTQMDETLCANFEQVCAISGVCDGNHEHEPWGLIESGNKRVFATALEVHYLLKLCEAIVHAFLLRLQLGLSTDDVVSKLQHAAKAFSGLQAVSSSLPPLVPAFQHKHVPFLLETAPIWPAAHVVPLHHKLLHNVKFGGVIGVENLERYKQRILEELKAFQVDFSWESFQNIGIKFDEMRLFGIAWEPDQSDELLAKALEVDHPMDISNALPVELRFVVKKTAQLNPCQIARQRVEFFKCWNSRAKELEVQEAEIRKNMGPHVSLAVKGKKLALFKEMLEFYNCRDLDMVNEFVEGATLTGDVPKTTMLPFKFTPALLSAESLMSQSRMRRSAVERDFRSSGDDEIDDVVWQQTLDECNLGWLEGPFTAEEIPESAPISRRFGLRQQQHKVRLIDDFNESAVNQAVTVYESPTLHTVDIAAAALSCWFSCCSELSCNSSLLVRTFELLSAYRQVALSEHGRAFDTFVSSIRTPDVRAKVLPFGAVKSVHAFLPLARAIWWLGTVACLLFWSSFFDDYIVFSPPVLAKNTEQTASALSTLLGGSSPEKGGSSCRSKESCEALGLRWPTGLQSC